MPNESITFFMPFIHEILAMSSRGGAAAGPPLKSPLTLLFQRGEIISFPPLKKEGKGGFYTAYVGLGSNLNDPLQQVQTALIELANIPSTKLVTFSKFYWSKSLLPELPDFVNAVACLTTQLSAHELLNSLHTIENLHGRQRLATRWGSRTLDLDLLLYGDEIITTEQLTVPHPEMLKRDFVLYPLIEISPQLILPTGEALLEVVKRGPKNQLEVCGDFTLSP